MSKGQIQVLGLKALLMDLKKFPLVKQAKILKSAHRKAAREQVINVLTPKIKFKTKVKGITKKGNVTEKKQVIIKNTKGSKTGLFVGIASDYFYYRFLEFGTKKRRTKRSVRLAWRYDGKHGDIRRYLNSQNRGRVAARPFIGTVLDKSVGKLAVSLVEIYSKKIDRAMKKKPSKNGL